MTSTVEIRTTADGSPTLYVPALDEHYHSRHGAVQESEHVFLRMGFGAHTLPACTILEVGFGTGLNALLTLREATRTGRRVRYVGLEKYPLTLAQAQALDYPALVGEAWRDAYERMHRQPPSPDLALNEHFTLQRQTADLTACPLPTDCDLVYFDAFAPDKQPELWTPAVFGRIYEATAPGGFLTTYSAKGSVRRSLLSVGFVVEKLPGPPGKREMLRARKPSRTA